MMAAAPSSIVGTIATRVNAALAFKYTCVRPGTTLKDVGAVWSGLRATFPAGFFDETMPAAANGVQPFRKAVCARVATDMVKPINELRQRPLAQSVLAREGMTAHLLEAGAVEGLLPETPTYDLMRFAARLDAVAQNPSKALVCGGLLARCTGDEERGAVQRLGLGVAFLCLIPWFVLDLWANRPTLGIAIGASGVALSILSVFLSAAEVKPRFMHRE